MEEGTVLISSPGRGLTLETASTITMWNSIVGVVLIVATLVLAIVNTVQLSIQAQSLSCSADEYIGMEWVAIPAGKSSMFTHTLRWNNGKIYRGNRMLSSNDKDSCAERIYQSLPEASLPKGRRMSQSSANICNADNKYTNCETSGLPSQVCQKLTESSTFYACNDFHEWAVAEVLDPGQVSVYVYHDSTNDYYAFDLGGDSSSVVWWKTDKTTNFEMKFDVYRNSIIPVQPSSIYEPSQQIGDVSTAHNRTMLASSEAFKLEELEITTTKYEGSTFYTLFLTIKKTTDPLVWYVRSGGGDVNEWIA